MTNKIVEGKKENKPTFRGRFGTRSKRKSSIAKWDKWRKPQGIDITWKRGDGNKPKVGYKVKKELRDLHPIGKPEMYIRCRSDIEKLIKSDIENNVFRMSGTLGKKKKDELVKLMETKKMIILNK